MSQTPSTFGKNSSSSSNDKKTRWQRTQADQDPILAPGYGRKSDLEALTAALNRGSSTKLPLEAVEALMKARGRGIRSSARGGAETPARDGTSGNAAAPAATPISSAWADFMKEEGVGVASTKKETTPTKRSGRKEEAAASSTSTTGASRVYSLFGETTKPSALKKSRKDAEAGGVLVQAGTLDTAMVGRDRISADDIAAKAYHLTFPTQLVLPTLVTKVFSAGHAVHALALDTNGQVYGWGRNEGQQLGSGLPTNVYWPTLLSDDSWAAGRPIVQAATGKAHSMFLTDQGDVYALGTNKLGQCGVKPGVASEMVGSPRLCAAPEGVEMAQISCGEDFSMAISTEGLLYSTGCSQYGQLGNGETGEYFVTANKLAFANCAVWTVRSTFCHGTDDSKVYPVPDSEHIRVQEVACGRHHSLVVEATAEGHEARVFSFGCGDYGCLGHGVQKDEFFPRQIAVLAMSHVGLDDNLRLSAGNSCSLLQTSKGHVYYWGKHRSVGEAVMRPQLVDVLANNQHQVSHVAAGSQTVACTTAHGQTVVWGQGPHGELGLKNGARSTAKPSFVDDLNGCHVQSLAASYGSIVYVLRQEKDDQAGIDQLVKLNEDAVADLVSRPIAPPAESKAKKGRKRK